MLNHPLLLVSVLVVLAPTRALDYCKAVHNCGGSGNLVCRRKNDCSPTENCQEVTIHKDVKDFILNEMNKIRKNAALGNAPPRKKAANMLAFSWDEELAYIAQCAVNVCEKRVEHACPAGSKFMNAHIIYTNRLDVLFDDDIDYFNETIQTWLGYGNGMGSLTDFGGPKYDYAALIVAQSSAVGCGWSRVLSPINYHNYNAHFFFAACVFAMMPSQAVFQEGAPCSKCPKGKGCNSQYKSLCGEVKYAGLGPKEDDDYYDYRGHPEGGAIGGGWRRRASLTLMSATISLHRIRYF